MAGEVSGIDAKRAAVAGVTSRSVFSNVVIFGSSILAIVSCALTSTIVAAMFNGFKIGQKQHSVDGAVGAFVFSLGMTLLFSWIARANYNQKVALQDLERERSVLAFAKKENRAVTIPEVALHCSLTVVDAAAVLNRFTARGVCLMDIGDEGELIYSFVNSLNRSRSADPESIPLKVRNTQEEHELR